MKKMFLFGASLIVLATGCAKVQPATPAGGTVPLSSGTTDATAGVYIDSAYNFQITLPQGFYENTGGYDGTSAYFKFFSTQPGAGVSITNIESGKDNTNALFQISIDHSQGTIYKSLSSVKAEDGATSPNIKYSDQKDLTVNGLPAYEVMGDATQSKGDVDNVCNLDTYIQQGSNVHEISLITANCTVALKYKDAYDASVSTFKFLK